MVALTTGAVTTGGAAVASAANTNSPAAVGNPNANIPNIDPASVPQILAISEYKPVDNLAEQLGRAVEYNKERIAADLAARAPLVVKPAEGAYTSGFGARWGSFHKGIDIANAVGTPILAAADGVVIDAGPAGGYGNWVRIRHEDGTITLYGHMETIECSVGQTVRAGQRIAGMGSRGWSTGSHLHFEVHPAGGDAIDPAPWLAARGISL